MSTQQTSPKDPPVRGPARFRMPDQEPEARSALSVVGGLVALLVLVVGVPLGLLLLDAPPPIPHGLPSREYLTQPLTTAAIFVVLRAIVWLAWLQFAVCLLVEAVSLVRGNGLPRPVPLSGPSQQLARSLVGLVLVGGAFVGSTAAATAAPSAPPAGSDVTTSAQAVTAQAPPDADRQRADGSVRLSTEHQQVQEQRQAQKAAAEVHHAGVPRDMTDVVGKKVYVVKSPDGHYHDNLWDIAEEHLGNGRRWHEIFELNQHRSQPDGGELVLGRLIQPGWVLIMPGDATGVDRVSATPTTPARSQEGALGGLSATSHRDGFAATDVERVDDATESDSNLAADLLGGGLFAAAVLGALVVERRRRRGRESRAGVLEAEVALRVGADADRATRLDRALRALGGLCRTEDKALPGVFAVTVSDEAVELRLAPARTDAPAPWAPVEDGRVWRLTQPVPEDAELAHAPYPGLVCLGRSLDGSDLLIDLESVGGVVSVQGADLVATEVVSALAVQLATSPWSDEQRVRGYQLSEVLADLGGDRLMLVDSLDPLLSQLESTQGSRSAQEVLTGRLARRPGVVPEYAVLGSAPDAELADRLSALAAGGARGFGVVAAGAVPGTRWELEVDESGTLRVPLLDTEVEAVRLTARSAELVADLLENARAQAPTTPDARVSVPASPRVGDDGRWSAAAVRLGVLGPVQTRSQGTLDPTRVALATELATFLALQSAPVHPSVLAASVWPRGVTPEVRDATVARVREWLGEDAEGNHLLRAGDDGRLALSPDVAVDWHAFCELAAKARRTGPREERELLRRALHLVRGPLLEDRPAGRYAWLARTRLETQVEDVVVDAAHRLVELCGNDRDPAGAAAAAQAGLRLAPGSQLLWRDLVRAQFDGPGGSEASAAAALAMVETLASLGAPVEAETDALVEELLPAHPATGVTGA